MPQTASRSWLAGCLSPLPRVTLLLCCLGVLWHGELWLKSHGEVLHGSGGVERSCRDGGQDTGVWGSVAVNSGLGSVPYLLKRPLFTFPDDSRFSRAFSGCDAAQIAPGEPSPWEKRAKLRGGKGWGTGPFFLECITNCLSTLGLKI